MRTLDELIDAREPGIELVRSWMAEARRPAELLACARADGAASLVQLQISTRSPMGALAYETGGLLIDGGWVRVLGSRCERLPRGLVDQNRVGAEPRLTGALLVGDDVVGGFFAVNGGCFGGERGEVFYLSPDTLEWEGLGAGYSDWLLWLLQGELEVFYADWRWPGWQDEVAALAGDEAFSIYPPLVFEGPSLAERNRRAVPVEELWQLYAVDLPTQLAANHDE
ncbi:MAG: DUF2625 family protein [Myxococcota bacterium]